ncbi:hypothetical protein DFH27DRAFT_72374 [Peziza echinospora]|nr:hypothetical protein DFH27DRAFT_72374 [Peziza echinospora]
MGSMQAEARRDHGHGQVMPAADHHHHNTNDNNNNSHSNTTTTTTTTRNNRSNNNLTSHDYQLALEIAGQKSVSLRALRRCRDVLASTPPPPASAVASSLVSSSSSVGHDAASSSSSSGSGVNYSITTTPTMMMTDPAEPTTTTTTTTKNPSKSSPPSTSETKPPPPGPKFIIQYEHIETRTLSKREKALYLQASASRMNAAAAAYMSSQHPDHQLIIPGAFPAPSHAAPNVQRRINNHQQHIIHPDAGGYRRQHYRGPNLNHQESKKTQTQPQQPTQLQVHSPPQPWWPKHFRQSRPPSPENSSDDDDGEDENHGKRKVVVEEEMPETPRQRRENELRALDEFWSFKSIPRDPGLLMRRNRLTPLPPTPTFGPPAGWVVNMQKPGVPPPAPQPVIAAMAVRGPEGVVVEMVGEKENVEKDGLAVAVVDAVTKETIPTTMMILEEGEGISSASSAEVVIEDVDGAGDDSAVVVTMKISTTGEKTRETENVKVLDIDEYETARGPKIEVDDEFVGEDGGDYAGKESSSSSSMTLASATASTCAPLLAPPPPPQEQQTAATTAIAALVRPQESITANSNENKLEGEEGVMHSQSQQTRDGDGDVSPAHLTPKPPHTQDQKNTQRSHGGLVLTPSSAPSPPATSQPPPLPNLPLTLLEQKQQKKQKRNSKTLALTSLIPVPIVDEPSAPSLVISSAPTLVTPVKKEREKQKMVSLGGIGSGGAGGNGLNSSPTPSPSPSPSPSSYRKLKTALKDMKLRRSSSTIFGGGGGGSGPGTPTRGGFESGNIGGVGDGEVVVADGDRDVVFSSSAPMEEEYVRMGVRGKSSSTGTGNSTGDVGSVRPNSSPGQGQLQVGVGKKGDGGGGGGNVTGSAQRLTNRFSGIAMRRRGGGGEVAKEKEREVKADAVVVILSGSGGGNGGG